MTKITSDDLETGSLYTCYIYHDNPEVHGEKKSRPIVVLEDRDKKIGFKVSTQVDKPFNKKYGYRLKDWKEAGCHSESVIVCYPKDRFEVKPEHIGYKLGEVTERDMIGFLTKLVKEMKKENDNQLER